MKTLFKSKPKTTFAGLVVAATFAGGYTLAQQTPTLSPPSVRDAHELSSVFRNVAKKTLPAIVSIQTKGRVLQASNGQMDLGEDHPIFRLFGNDPALREMLKQRERRAPSGSGSGFIIDPAGYIMTNAHVVNGAERVTVTLQDGRTFNVAGDDIKMDPGSDVAVLKIANAGSLAALPFGDNDRIEIGDWVLAIGSPFGYDMTVTQGIISAKGRDLDRSTGTRQLLQTDAAINPGNSGGPLINLNGEVIGVNVAISTRSGGYDGISFAIPVNRAKWVARQLIENGSVQRAFLGVAIDDVTAENARAFGLNVPRGAVVLSVVENTPADRAGLVEGDVILEIDGRRVLSRTNLQSLIERLEMGRQYRLKVLRDGREMSLPITLIAQDDRARGRAINKVVPAPDSRPQQSTDLLGLTVEPVSRELAERMNLASVRGVVVTYVDPDGIAGRKGIRAGDVIHKLGRNSIRNGRDYNAALKNISPDDGVLVLVENASGRRFVTLSAGE